MTDTTHNGDATADSNPRTLTWSDMGEPQTELRVALRNDIADRTIEFHDAMRASTIALGDEFDRLSAATQEAEWRMGCAVERLELLERVVAQARR